jgi:ribonuclease-3
MLKWFRPRHATTAASDWLKDYPVEPALLRLALTHKSAEGNADNERLEFLGDAVLELVVSEYLYSHYPAYSEGKLTKARVVAVSEPTLAEAARRLGLGKQLRMSRGEEASGGRDRPSILSDAFEAVVAAIYMSLGLEAARKFVTEQIGFILGEVVERDFKSRLQERTQQTMRATPTYRIIGETGPPHDRAFIAQVSVGKRVLARGEGRSKKIAEQAAAELALEELNLCPTPSSPPKTSPEPQG